MLLRFRRSEPALRQRSWLTGESDGAGNTDVVWWHAQGREMTDDDWNGSETAFGMLLAAPAAPAGPAGAGGKPLLIVIHGFSEQEFTLPPLHSPAAQAGSTWRSWRLRWSSGSPDTGLAPDRLFAASASLGLDGLAVTAFSGSAREP
jgi:pullulanase/glycogen debranching enzyme